jgi:hypothetical protein
MLRRKPKLGREPAGTYMRVVMANWLFQEGPRLETGSGSNPLGNQRVIAPDRLPDSGDLSWEPSGKGLAVREDGQAGN